MNIRHVLALSGMVGIIALLSTGCATKAPMVDTWCNPQFSATPKDPIALTDHPASTPQDAALGQLLTNELHQAGFIITSPDQADYMLAYVMDEAVKYNHQYIPPEYNPVVNVQSDSQIFATSVQMDAIPARNVTYRFTSHYIRLLLYTNPKTHHGDFQLVWQGNIDVNHSVSAPQEQALIKTLLNYFGKQQNGRVSIKPQG